MFPASHRNCVDGSDIKHTLFSLLNLKKMSLVGHYFMKGEVHILKDITKFLPLTIVICFGNEKPDNFNFEET